MWSHSSGSLTAGTLTVSGTRVEETVCPAFWYSVSLEPSVNLKQGKKKKKSSSREPGPREWHEEALSPFPQSLFSNTWWEPR